MTASDQFAQSGCGSRRELPFGIAMGQITFLRRIKSDEPIMLSARRDDCVSIDDARDTYRGTVRLCGRRRSQLDE
jgi:hypothetical protein